MKPKVTFMIIVMLAIVGFVLSLMATIVEVQGGDSKVCFSQDDSCGSVLSSKYGSIFGIPVGTWGGLYFLFILLWLLLSAQDWIDYACARRVLLFVTTIAIFGSIGFICIMAFVLKTFCTNCMAVHVTNFVMFGVTYFHLQNKTMI